MFSDKLATLLLALSPAEMQRLAKFVDSPYFNEQAVLSRLFQYLRSTRLQSDEALAKLSKAQIWQHLVPEQPYSDNQIRKYFYELTQLIYEFLTVSKQEQNKLDGGLKLLSAIDRPNLEKHKIGIERKLEEIMDENKTWQADHFLYAHTYRFSVLNQDVPTKDFLTHLGSTKQYLEVFFILRNLKIAITMITYSLSRNNKELPVQFIDFHQFCTNSGLNQIPIVQVYLAAYQSFLAPENEELYFTFRQSLQDQYINLSEPDLFDLFQYAINFCVMRINGGNLNYYRELFELYRSMSDNQLILSKGELAEGMFKNIITAGLGVKEYDWVEHFIKSQSQYLPELVRENAMSFNLANVYFSQRKFDEVIGLLQKVEYSDVVYHLGARWLLIRTYYELDALKPLDSLLDSFRVYLLRNKVLSASTKKEYLSLISSTRRLLKSKFEKDKLIQLKAKVMTTQIKLPKRWLIEKIEELEKN
jgi:hypothetical protein